MSHLMLVNPPARPGHTNERDQSGGIGVSRKLKPGEAWRPSLPPLDMLNLAAVAEEAEIQVQLIDLLLEGISGERALDFVQQRAGAGQDGELWIGVRLSIPSLPLDLSFANALKARFPGARVFGFGGVIMSTYRHWIASCQVDFLVYGEPEAVMLPVFAAGDWRLADGVIDVGSYEPDGKDPFDPLTAADYLHWVRTKDLARIPRPAWHLVEMERYPASGKASDNPGIVQASRGCPIACNMCAYTMLEGGPIRPSEAARVVDEIEYLQKTYGMTQFRFRDANFSYDRKLLKAIIAELSERKLSIEAAAELSLEMLDRATLESMYEAGIRTVLTGIETDDPAVMGSVGQNIKVNPLIAQKLRWCDEIGIKVYTFFLVGMPEETWASLKRTVAFAKAIGTETTLTLLSPFPGTPIYWRALKEGLMPKEMVYEQFDSYTPTARTYSMSLSELRRARVWARLETIVPYRLAEARKRGRGAYFSTAVHHLPHIAARQALRTYVWWHASLVPAFKHRSSAGAAAAAS